MGFREVQIIIKTDRCRILTVKMQRISIIRSLERGKYSKEEKDTRAFLKWERPYLDFKEEKWQCRGPVIRINITEIRFGEWRTWTGVITSGNISVESSPTEGSESKGNLSKAWGCLILRPLAKKAASGRGTGNSMAFLQRKNRAATTRSSA